MTAVNTAIDQAELVKELKGLEAGIVAKFDELKSNGETLKGQIRELGEAKADTLAKHEALEKQYNELYDRVQAVEQKGIKSHEESKGFDLGGAFVKHEQTEGHQEPRGEQGL